jgi:hypothetical protein
VRDEEGVSTIIGAIIVLAIMGTALVYVNAFQVPRQGAALEVDAAERAEAALLSLASALQTSSDAPSVHKIPLQADRGTPPLLAGVILTPVRPGGSAGLNASSPQITMSVILDTPAGGVPSGDPIREATTDGRMRLFLLGNSTNGFGVGSLVAHTGGAYTERAEYAIEAGMLISTSGNVSAPLAAPAISIQRGAVTSLAWRIPILAGADEEIAGISLAQIGLRPGPESALGGGRVYSAVIRVETTNVAAWRLALEEVLGTTGIITTTLVGEPDNGTVEALVLAPTGTPATTAAIELHLWAIRNDLSIEQRT